MGLGGRHRPSGRGRRQRGDVIGLDLGATAVRAVILGEQHHTPIRVGSVTLPPGAVTRGVVTEPQAVTAALRRLAAENRLAGRTVVVGVGTPQVVVRALTLPAMPPDKLRLTLPFQAREVLPIPVSDAVLDFTPLPGPGLGPARGSGQSPAAPDGSSMVSGLLTAAPRLPVTALVRAVERAGLSVARVDLAPFAVLRSVGSAGAAVEALVDIGAELTTIVIHRHGIPHVVRVVAFGGRRLTERVADALGTGPDEAESAKRTVGVIGDSVPALELRDELRTLLAEIRASLQYFVTSVGSAVQRVLLTGGTSGMPGLAGMLGADLGTAVGVASPLRHLIDFPGGAPPGASVAPGGGLPGHGGLPEHGALPDRGGSPRHGGLPEYALASAVSVGLALGAIGRAGQAAA